MRVITNDWVLVMMRITTLIQELFNVAVVRIVLDQMHWQRFLLS